MSPAYQAGQAHFADARRRDEPDMELQWKRWGRRDGKEHKDNLRNMPQFPEEAQSPVWDTHWPFAEWAAGYCAAAWAAYDAYVANTQPQSS